MKKINTDKVNYNSPVYKLLLEVDQLAYETEIYWGMGTLPLIAGKEVADKFQQAQDKMVDAINSGDYDTAKAKCEVVKRGWQKMIQIAKDAGYDKEPSYQKMVNDKSIEYWLVKDDIDGKMLAARYPAKASAIVTGAFIVDMLCTMLTPNQTGSLGEYNRIMAGGKTENEILLDDKIPW